MAFDKITEYSSTNASNTAIGDVNVDEGMLPSAVNNAIREQMTHLKESLGSGTPLYVDQTNNRLGVNNAAPATALDVTGVITTDGMTTSADISFGDNNKATFGDAVGGDLQIYHNSTDGNSFIDDAGTGSLAIRGSQVNIAKYTGETMAQFVSDGAVNLYHNDVKKFETTSYGIDISGSVVADTNTSVGVGATPTPDMANYQNFIWTLNAAGTLGNPSTEKVGQTGFFVFIQDGTGGRTLSLGSEYKTAGGAGITLSTAASAVDVVPYIVQATGTILLGAPQLAFA